SNIAYLLLYVDDIILTASSSVFLLRIIASLHNEFAMTDLCSLNYFLVISAQRSASGLFLSQLKFAEEILKRAHMQNYNPCRTPVDTESKLGSDGDPVSDPTLYRSLLPLRARTYLMLSTSPKTTAWNEFSSTMASAIICLATNQKFNFSKFILKGRIYGVKYDLGEAASKRGRVINSIDADEVHYTGQNENVVEEVVDAAQVSTAATTVTITTEEITLAQALEALKTSKPKVKRIVFQEPSTITIISSQQSQDKGKGIMIEEPVKPMKKKVQIMLDEEAALKLQAEFDEEERFVREKAKKEKEANISLIEEWERLFKPKIDAAISCETKRTEEKRNKPPIKAQQRQIMYTYLKNMEGYKLKDLKSKGFDSIQEMFDRAFKRIHRIEKSYYQIMRADGKSQMYMLFSQMLKSFDRGDLEDLYKLVKAKYKSTRPVEDLDLLLWGNLKTMFEPHVKDTIWRNQQGYKVLEWKLYDSCRVHSLMMQHVHIYMLVEKKYPLAPLTLSMMLEKKLQIDYKVKWLISFLNSS
ncbi:putative ribonuclease H-like domain-containing protein, partial [Tanacetum coccineum]